MASISIDDARYIVGKTYPGLHWKEKVRRMSDKQVLKLYFTFLEQGKLDPKPKVVAKPVAPKVEPKPVEEPAAEQMWMDFIFE